MPESLIAISVFTGMVTTLSAAVLLIRHALVASKPVKLAINGQREALVNSGNTLLKTLAEADVNLPSACGGQGTCGQCRVVIEGTCPALLPIERNLINQNDERSGTRLACMHKVYGDMSLRVPGSALAAGAISLVVAKARLLSPTLLELTCKPEGNFPETLAAGDYLVLEAPPTRIDFATITVDASWESVWQNQGYRSMSVELAEPTRRAYSLANAPQQDNHIQFVVRLALPPEERETGIPPGQVSSWLFSLRRGDRLRATGPYGNFHVTEQEGEIICIGGGAGIAPLRSIVRDLLLCKHSTQKLSFWYGSRDRRELVYADEFATLERQHPNFSFHPALSEPQAEDHWQGATGFIHEVIETGYLADHPAPESVHYYLCGPPPMTAGALHMLDRLGVPSSAIIFDNFGSQTTHASDLPGIT